ncbi:MAG: serine/threonine-protein kinase [Pirellulaceae bacterium]
MNEPTSRDPEEDFAHDLEKRHEEILKGESIANNFEPQSDNSLLEKAIPVLNLLEDMRRLQQEHSRSLVDTSRGQSSTKDRESLPFDLDYRNAQRLGRFEILDHVGQGGFGVVFRAVDGQLHREVALKIPRFEVMLRNESLQRFEREALAAAALNHPNIVRLYETGSDGGVNYIISELVDGPDLASYVEQNGVCDSNFAATIAQQLADALEHAHARGVLHRDLKPSNVLVESTTGRPQISDFGLASIQDLDEDVTRSGSAIGTPAYMAPEQADHSFGLISPATDIYGLGTILYFALSGRPPVQAESTLETLRAVASVPPPAFRLFGLNVPRDLEAICFCCLEKDPLHRYTSAKELSQDLLRFLAGKPVAARAITPLTRLLRWLRQHPAIASSVAAAFLFLIVALVATVFGWRSSNQLLQASRDAETQSQKNLAELKRLVDVYLREIEADPALKNFPGAKPIRTRLLNHALEYYETLSVEYFNQSPEVANEAADTEYRISRILIEVGKPSDALTHIDAARRALPAASPQTQESAIALLAAKLDYQSAVAHNLLGERDLALQECSACIDQTLKTELDLEPVTPEFRLDASELLARAYRMRSRVQRELRSLDQAAQDGQEAVRRFETQRESTEVTANEPSELTRLELDGLSAKGELALIYKAMGRIPEAIELDQAIVERSAHFLESDPNNWQAAVLLVKSAIDVAKFQLRGSAESAVNTLLPANTVAQRLSNLHPDVTNYQSLASGVREVLAAAYDLSGQPDRAYPLFVENLAKYRELADAPQAGFDDRLRYAGAINNLVTWRFMHGRSTDEDLTIVQEAMAICTELLNQKTGDEHLELMRCGLLQCQVWIAAENHKVEEALQLSTQAIDHLAQLRASGSKHPQTLAASRMLHDQRAELLEAEREFELALPHRVAAATFAEMMGDVNSPNLQLVLAHMRLGHSTEASAAFDKVDYEAIQASAPQRLLLARIYALRSRSAAKNSGWLVKSLAILSELAASGAIEQTELKKTLLHSDFDSLRSNLEFNLLLVESDSD